MPHGCGKALDEDVRDFPEWVEKQM